MSTLKRRFTNRGIHRDVAFFYIGLILAFALSGIVLNHRQSWYPRDYVFESQEVDFQLPQGELTEDQLRKLIAEFELEYDGHRVRDNTLRIYTSENAIFDVDMESGKGVLEYKRRVPILGHSIVLHQSTDSFWIWYSDIFGAAMILIAITGTLIPSGNNSFRKRGWKLMVAGLIFPLVFLLVF